MDVEKRSANLLIRIVTGFFLLQLISRPCRRSKLSLFSSRSYQDLSYAKMSIMDI